MPTASGSMRPALPFLLGLLLTLVGCTTTGELRSDSQRHLWLSGLSSYQATLVARSQGFGPTSAALTGNVLTLGLGVGKETYDALHPAGSGWGWDDLLCDVVGSLAGSSLALLLES